MAGKDVNKETSKAKKADILNITFDIDANRVSESGIKNIHIVLIQPDGNLAIVNGSRNQTFRMANGDLKPYSGLKAISFKTGERVSDVSIEWESNDSFQKGNYQIELYEKGYLIGNSTLTLK